MSTSQIRNASSRSPTAAPVGTPTDDDRPSAARLLDEIRHCTRAGEIRTAQRLAREAAARYPEDAGLQKARRVLTGEVATSRPRTGRSLRDEYGWLKSPPAEYRGRWVALIGREVVAAADSLEKLRELLPSHLDQTPLAVRVAS